jgi:hypothetical protein
VPRPEYRNAPSSAIGADHIDTAMHYRYDDKPWIALELDYSFARFPAPKNNFRQLPAVQHRRGVIFVRLGESKA